MLCLAAYCIIHIKFPSDKKIHLTLKIVRTKVLHTYLFTYTHIYTVQKKNCYIHNLIIDDGKSIEIMWVYRMSINNWKKVFFMLKGKRLVIVKTLSGEHKLILFLSQQNTTHERIYILLLYSHIIIHNFFLSTCIRDRSHMS